MSKEIKDGGTAFPESCTSDGYRPNVESGMSLRDYFASHAPTITEQEISRQYEFDKNRNPYNDVHKPKLRSRMEIIVSHNWEYAHAMLKEREASNVA